MAPCFGCHQMRPSSQQTSKIEKNNFQDLLICVTDVNKLVFKFFKIHVSLSNLKAQFNF